MSEHAYVSTRLHFVISTKERQQFLKGEEQGRLWAYLGGIARNLGMKVYAIGGADDHAHVFVGLPATISVSEAVQKLKANSSRWMHENGHRGFQWQEGYAAFSVGISQTESTMKYIQHQAEHHNRRRFAEEWEEIIRMLRA